MILLAHKKTFLKTRRLLAYIAATLTRHDRRLVDLEFYPDSITGSAFRLFNYLFGERVGIRSYNAVEYETKGAVRQPVLIQCFCWEAVIAHFEWELRRAVKRLFSLQGLGLHGIRIITPKFAATNGLQMPSSSPFLFAIARDTSTNFGGGTGTTTVTFASYPMAATATGILFFGMYGQNSGDTVTGQTFNAVSGTKITAKTPSYRQGYLFYFLAATGTHDIVITMSANPDGVQGAGFSYTGCAVGAIDAQATNTASGVTSITAAVTVVALNCWIAGFVIDNGGNVASGSVSVLIAASGANYGILDTNTTVSQGGVNFDVSITSSGNAAICAASFAPVVVDGMVYVMGGTLASHGLLQRLFPPEQEAVF